MSAKDPNVSCEGKDSGEKAMAIEDSTVQDFPNVEPDEEIKGFDEEDSEKRAKQEPLKVNPLFKDFSYLDDDSTSMFVLLEMARAGATGTFKLAKWTLPKFNKINIKIRGLKENPKIIPKESVPDILIDRMVDLESSFHDFKSLCEDRLVALEAKILGMNTEIISFCRCVTSL